MPREDGLGARRGPDDDFDGLNTGGAIVVGATAVAFGCRRGSRGAVTVEEVEREKDAMDERFCSPGGCAIPVDWRSASFGRGKAE